MPFSFISAPSWFSSMPLWGKITLGFATALVTGYVFRRMLSPSSSGKSTTSDQEESDDSGTKFDVHKPLDPIDVSKLAALPTSQVVMKLRPSRKLATIPVHAVAIATPNEFNFHRLRIGKLQNTLDAIETMRATNFDKSSDGDKNLLQRLWKASFGAAVPFEEVGERWNELGFQGLDPTTDFRGGGMLSLVQLVYFAEHYPHALKKMMDYNKKVFDEKKMNWFLTAVVSIQFSVTICGIGQHSASSSGGEKTTTSTHSSGKKLGGFKKTSSSPSSSSDTNKNYNIFAQHLAILYEEKTPYFGDKKTASHSQSASPEKNVCASPSLTSSPQGAINMNENNNASTTSSSKSKTLMAVDSDKIVGVHELHSQLMLHFFERWREEEPSVMEFQQWIGNVYKGFFSDKKKFF